MVLSNPFILVVEYTGLMAFVGVLIYLMFYLMFKKLYSAKLEHSEPEKDEIVMCGEKPIGNELVIPVSRIFVDIITRSFRRGISMLRNTLGSPILHDWFFYMLIILITLIILSIAMGVHR